MEHKNNPNSHKVQRSKRKKPKMRESNSFQSTCRVHIGTFLSPKKVPPGYKNTPITESYEKTSHTYHRLQNNLASELYWDGPGTDNTFLLL